MPSIHVRFGIIAAKLLAAAALAGSVGACASTQSAGPAKPFMASGETAFAPLGFLDFCTRRPDDCRADSSTIAPVASQAPLMAAADAHDEAPTAIQAARPASWASVPGAAPSISPTVLPRLWKATWTDPMEPVGSIAAPTIAAPATAPADGWQTRGIGPGLAASAPAAPIQTVFELNEGGMAQLERVNRRINRALISREDYANGVLVDRWDLPLAAGRTTGDCEDFVLEKRHALIAEGVPARALSIAVVRTRKGQLHAVLVVRTSKGDMVLDNLSAWVTPWSQVGYEWLQRQSSEDPLKWTTVAGGADSAG